VFVGRWRETERGVSYVFFALVFAEQAGGEGAFCRLFAPNQPRQNIVQNKPASII